MTYQQFLLRADTYEELDQTREDIPVEDGGEVHIIATDWQNNIKDGDYNYSSINLCRYDGDTDRNLHISFRPQLDMIVINHKIDNRWVYSEELRFKFSDWLRRNDNDHGGGGVKRGHFRFIIGFSRRYGHYYGASVEGGKDDHKPFVYKPAQGRKSWYVNYQAESNRCFGDKVLIKYMTGENRLVHVP